MRGYPHFCPSYGSLMQAIEIASILSGQTLRDLSPADELGLIAVGITRLAMAILNLFAILHRDTEPSEKLRQETWRKDPR